METSVAVHFTGFILTTTIVLHLVLLAYIYRQRIYSFVVPLFIYLNILLVLVELSTLFLLQEQASPLVLGIMKARLVLELFIPPILVLMVQEFALGSLFPRILLRYAWPFLLSLLMAVLAIKGVFFQDVFTRNGVVFPALTNYYWTFLFYFCATFFYVGNALYRKYRKSHQSLKNILVVLHILLPITVVAFCGLHLFPLFRWLHPFIFLAYPVMGFVLLFVAFRFRLLEYEEKAQRLVFFLMASAVLSVFFAFFVKGVTPLFFLAAMLLWLIAYGGSCWLLRKMQPFLTRESEKNYSSVEEELAQFLGEVGRLLDEKELAQFLGNFSTRVLKCTKVAVVFSRFDIRPYEVMYNQGFADDKLAELLGASRSKIMEMLEYDHQLIYKFEHSPHSKLFQEMERYHLCVVLPLVAQNNLMGFIFLGAEKEQMQFFSHDLRFARLFAVQAANAIQNVRAIQKAMQSEKMAELGTMASQLAHDFQSFITLVKLDAPQNGRLRNHALYMEKLVQDLLNYTRPQELRFRPIHINQLIDMTLDLLEIPPNITVEKHYARDLPQINVDSNQMRRVFLNLLENSIRAMREKGGRLKITTRPLRPLSPYRRNPWIYIEILDEGEGIPEEFLEKIFEPFFTTHKHEGGNGMGLAIVKQIITRHRGFIDVASKVGKGTIFNIRLPYIA